MSVGLTPSEGFVLSRVEREPATAAEIVAKVYQGGYSDFYVTTPLAAERVLVRVQGPGALELWSEGAKVGLVLPKTGATAFPPGD